MCKSEALELYLNLPGFRQVQTGKKIPYVVEHFYQSDQIVKNKEWTICIFFTLLKLFSIFYFSIAEQSLFIYSIV
jgi:hypothetical protein